MGVEKVASGVDTLVVGYLVARYLDDGDLEVLKGAKEKAQEKRKMFGSTEGASFEFHGVGFGMMPRGQSGYDYIFRNDDVTVRVAREARGGRVMPEVHVSYRSHYLATVGLKAASDQVRRWLDLWADVVGEKVSRADLFVDLAMESFPKIAIKTEIVSLARGKAEFCELPVSHHVEGRRSTGVTVGRGNVMCRVYDKTVEIRKMQKEWVQDGWTVNGWDEVLLPTVARIEFQCRREYLKQMSVSTVDDLIERTADIWWYLTHEWLRICEAGSATNQARWEVKAFWKVVQSSVMAFGERQGILRLKVKMVRYQHLMDQIRGCMVSAGAVLASGLGLEEGLVKITQDVRSVVSADDFRADVEERQAAVSNMLKPTTHLVDATLQSGTVRLA